MKYRYSKFTGEDLDDLDLEELLSKLSDLLLSSGFDNPYGLPYDDDHARALGRGAARCHPRGAAERRHAVRRDAREAARQGLAAGRRRRGADRAADPADHRQAAAPGLPDIGAGAAVGDAATRVAPARAARGPEAPVRFEITDKSLDFLGYRALRDLLGSIGKSSLGRHDTREMATGIEASGAPKVYEFGDTMNLDASGTILNAVMRREGGRHRVRSTSTTKT